jgi:hypothetical protein
MSRCFFGGGGCFFGGGVLDVRVGGVFFWWWGFGCEGGGGCFFGGGVLDVRVGGGVFYLGLIGCVNLFFPTISPRVFALLIISFTCVVEIVHDGVNTPVPQLSSTLSPFGRTILSTILSIFLYLCKYH